MNSSETKHILEDFVNVISEKMKRLINRNGEVASDEGFLFVSLAVGGGFCIVLLLGWLSGCC